MAPKGDDKAIAVCSSKLETLLSMKGGQGESSYANNSQAQAQHARSVMHLLEETLEAIFLRSPAPESPFVVADLGCSSGTNTIHMADFVVRHAAKWYESAGLEIPEFMVYFSDLPSNDFNTLFKLLPQLMATQCMEDCLASDTHRRYFAGGVAGSFYRRLFPERSVHIFHSAFSLHWLSQVPDVVVDKSSVAYNKGRVFIHGGRESTASAYRKQFQTDLAAFLKARSQELKRGGVMFLVCLARTSHYPTDQGGAGLLFGTHFQDAWDDLVQEGLIPNEKRDGFNIPVYAPSLQDFAEVVEADGSFGINRLEVFKGGSPLVLNRPDDEADVGRAFASSCRSVSGVLVEAHIGERLSEELFSRVERRATANAKELLEYLQFFHIVASLQLAPEGASK